jgi:two-component system response regulator DegU
LGTTKNHVERIRTKLGASDRTQAVVRALELGLARAPNLESVMDLR